MKYRAFKDECRLHRVSVPECGSHVTFVLPMPKAWSKRKRAEMESQAHQQTPDVDNLTKALLDAIYTDDKAVWDIRTTKVWGVEGSIEIRQGEFEKPME